MKKNYFILFLSFITLSAFAQNMARTTVTKHVPLNQVQRNAPSSTQSLQSFYTDYDFMDEDFQVNVQGFAYSRFIWDMNMNYSLANGDTSFKWAAVDFDPLYDSYNGGALVPASSYSAINIDTVFMIIGHSNYSGMNDTLLVKVVQCTAAGYPNPTGIVLHTDTIIGNTSFTGSNTWLSAGVLAIPTGCFINNNTTKFAVRVEYYGSAQDTFGIIAGFGDLGSGQCAVTPLTNYAMLSHYATNSYRHDMRFAAPPYNLQQLPTSTNADTYYECDGAQGHTLGSDAENYLQNWNIWIHCTTDPLSIGEVEGVLAVGQNIPNPFNGTTEIPYELKNNSNVTLTVYDVTGNEILSQSETTTIGKHSFTISSANLAAGIYYYTVATPEGKVTHKMVIAE